MMGSGLPWLRWMAARRAAAMRDRRDWLARCEWNAAQGDAEAQLALAWTYWQGELVPKDLHAAEEWFRHAEAALPTRARFELAKMLILERDPRFAEVLRADYEAENGAALFLHAVVELHGKLGRVDREQGLDYFRRAGQSHLIARFCYWKLRPMSFWERVRTTPQALRLTWEIIRVKWRDFDDERVRN